MQSGPSDVREWIRSCDQIAVEHERGAMLSAWDVALIASGWMAWLSKEIFSGLVKRSLARAGRFSVIEGQSGIFFNLDTVDVGTLTLKYLDNMGSDSYSLGYHFKFLIDCQLTNDSDTQVVYTNPMIDLWGVDGLRTGSLP
jgi:hypothetical protein